ncbi:MAG: hypothetical protein ACLTMP_08150 [Eggerthella lenta]
MVRFTASRVRGFSLAPCPPGDRVAMASLGTSDKFDTSMASFALATLIERVRLEQFLKRIAVSSACSSKRQGGAVRRTGYAAEAHPEADGSFSLWLFGLENC